ncbi:MAG: DUF6134 family protein [Hyphomonadaceae bacterium]|nr:DUF6134 family protein [Hyphomonadaceae bacterium]
MRPRAIFGSVLAAFALFSTPAHAQDWKPSDGDKLVFDVFRDGSKFGSHVVVFKQTGDDLTVDSDINLKVNIGPLTVFHYVHDVTERYSASRLMSVAAKTKKDGRWKQLAAQATEGGLIVAGAAFKGLLSGVVIPSTHWNAAEMKQAAMFSTETGAMLPMKITDMGIEQVKVGAGTIEARRYNVKSEIEANFWYDASGRWVKCAFTAQGSKVDYVLRELPS